MALGDTPLGDQQGSAENINSIYENILSQIERAVIDRLREKGLPQVKAYEIKTDSQNKYMTPAVRCVVADGKFIPKGQVSWRVDVNIYVIIIFRNISDEESRRKGVYPILMGVLNHLTGQNLGLKIDNLVPVTFREITNAKDEEIGHIVFQIPFTTGFTIEKISDEVITDLISMGINYFHNAEDAGDNSSVPDARDYLET